MGRNNTIKLLAYLVLLVVALFLPINVIAKSGCCSWHGGVSYCDTSVGRYVCNDGTYSPSCTCSYIPPKPACALPVVGKSGNFSFKSDNCSQDVIFTWDKGVYDEFYSIAISKVAGSDPGPISDTTKREFIFQDVQPGMWYVNVKPGRSCGWGNIFYWKVEVPEVEPDVEIYETVISEDERNIHYSVKCAERAEITPEIGEIPTGTSFITIKPTKDQNYTLTAVNGAEKSSASVHVSYPIKESSLVEEPTDSVTSDSIYEASETSQSQTSPWSVLLAGLGILGILVYAKRS